MKYEGIEDLGKMLAEGLSKSHMVNYFKKLLENQNCHVQDLIDVKTILISTTHNLKCDIGNWGLDAHVKLS